MPTRNLLKMNIESSETVQIVVKCPTQEVLSSENSEIENPNELEQVNVANFKDENIETVEEFSEGSIMMTFANGSMKVPNFIISNVESLASDSTIQNSVPVEIVQNVVPNLTPSTRAQNKGRIIKVSNTSSFKNVTSNYIKLENNYDTPSQDDLQWSNTPIKRFVAKRKIQPINTSTPIKVENTDEDHAYVSKHQAPIITMKKLIPPQNKVKATKIADRICRLCLKYKDNLTPIFWGDRTKPHLKHFLKVCCTLEVNRDDPMPKSICCDCKMKLLAAWDFRTQCHKSDSVLRKYYKLPQKNDGSPEDDKGVAQMDKGIQVECYDHSKTESVMPLRSLNQENIKEDKDSDDNLNADDFVEAGNCSEENVNNKDENSVSYFLESFAQEISNDVENYNDDQPEEVNEVENSEEQKIAKKETKGKRTTIRRRKKIQEKGRFLCHICPRVFTTKAFLERHANLHLTKKTFTCETCSKVFKTEEKLTVHLRVHDKTKRFECDVCGLKYAYEYLLNSHLRLHGKGKPLKTEKNFLCEVCSKSFVSQSGLKHHQKLHMDLKPYKCKFCEKTFTMPVYRKKHEVRHAEDRQFKCHLCPATYASTNGLTNHLLLHTGEAHYHCKTCGKSFRRRKYLNEHTYTHTGEKPYICKMCGIGYGNSGSLFAHQKRCKISFIDELAQPENEEIVFNT